MVLPRDCWHNIGKHRWDGRGRHRGPLPGCSHRYQHCHHHQGPGLGQGHPGCLVVSAQPVPSSWCQTGNVVSVALGTTLPSLGRGGGPARATQCPPVPQQTVSGALWMPGARAYRSPQVPGSPVTLGTLGCQGCPAAGVYQGVPRVPGPWACWRCQGCQGSPGCRGDEGDTDTCTYTCTYPYVYMHWGCWKPRYPGPRDAGGPGGPWRVLGLRELPGVPTVPVTLGAPGAAGGEGGGAGSPAPCRAPGAQGAEPSGQPCPTPPPLSPTANGKAAGGQAPPPALLKPPPSPGTAREGSVRPAAGCCRHGLIAPARPGEFRVLRRRCPGPLLATGPGARGAASRGREGALLGTRRLRGVAAGPRGPHGPRLGYGAPGAGHPPRVTGCHPGLGCSQGTRGQHLAPGLGSPQALAEPASTRLSPAWAGGKASASLG